MKRIFALSAATAMLLQAFCISLPSVHADATAGGDAPAVDLFDAMQSGDVTATFIAKNSLHGRIILKNNTDGPLEVQIPDAFIGVPQMQAQFGGGGGGGGFGGGGQGGGQQSVGGGGGGFGGRGGGGGGRGGGGGGRGGGGGGRRGGFSVPPEKVVRVDVPLLCLDHGLREPSSSKPYSIRPIENYISDPAVIAIVGRYASGDLPTGAAQAAVWNLNSGTEWSELAAKQTGTERNIVREPYFSREELQTAQSIAEQAQLDTADQKVEPREFKLADEAAGDDVAREVTEAAVEDEAEAKAGGESSESSDAESKPEHAKPAAEVTTAATAG
jgi:hypothetical protein